MHSLQMHQHWNSATFSQHIYEAHQLDASIALQLGLCLKQTAAGVAVYSKFTLQVPLGHLPY